MPSIIKRNRVRAESTDAPPPLLGKAADGCARKSHRKAVELLRIEGRVQAIELTCSCGEKTLIELDYEEAQTPPQAAGNSR